MRKAAIASAITAALFLSGCGAHPERKCVAPGAADTVLSLIYDKVDRTIEATDWSGSRVISDSKLKLATKTLERQRFVTLSNFALASYDKSTRRTVCMAEAHFHLGAIDKTAARRTALKGLNLGGLTAPEDLYGSDPLDNIQFISQPTPDGKDVLIQMGGLPDTVSAVLAVASARIASPAPAQ